MRKLILVTCTIVFLFSTFQIVSYVIDTINTNKIYDGVAGIYYQTQEDTKDIEKYKSKEKVQTKETNSNEESEDENGTNSNKESEEKVENKIADLKSINSDIVGWLTIPKTRIDYPVVQGADNSYYLDHDINYDKNNHGAIFIDYRNDLREDKNIIIYGHHMRDGTMFKDLVKFKDQTFFNENRFICLDINGNKKKYEVFSSYIIKADDLDIKLSLKDSKDYKQYFELLKTQSQFQSNVNFSEKGTIITLITCTYEYNDARFLVHAISAE